MAISSPSSNIRYTPYLYDLVYFLIHQRPLHHPFINLLIGFGLLPSLQMTTSFAFSPPGSPLRLPLSRRRVIPEVLRASEVAVWVRHREAQNEKSNATSNALPVEHTSAMELANFFGYNPNLEFNTLSQDKDRSQRETARESEPPAPALTELERNQSRRRLIRKDTEELTNTLLSMRGPQEGP
ncbi:uncharacterized protein VTP21DRAFT_10264 [Calcarisporiella thermophila]|uniref:uncharacterized protein n=1 Tax=Calcarisporiella thermophila TaxID=911321 RepID=UPI00374254B4